MTYHRPRKFIINEILCWNKRIAANWTDTAGQHGQLWCKVWVRPHESKHNNCYNLEDNRKCNTKNKWRNCWDVEGKKDRLNWEKIDDFHATKDSWGFRFIGEHRKNATEEGRWWHRTSDTTYRDADNDKDFWADTPSHRQQQRPINNKNNINITNNKTGKKKKKKIGALTFRTKSLWQKNANNLLFSCANLGTTWKFLTSCSTIKVEAPIHIVQKIVPQQLVCAWVE